MNLTASEIIHSISENSFIDKSFIDNTVKDLKFTLIKDDKGITLIDSINYKNIDYKFDFKQNGFLYVYVNKTVICYVDLTLPNDKFLNHLNSKLKEFEHFYSIGIRQFTKILCKDYKQPIHTNHRHNQTNIYINDEIMYRCYIEVVPDLNDVNKPYNLSFNVLKMDEQNTIFKTINIYKFESFISDILNK